MATAAIIAGGAAEIQNVSEHHPASKPSPKHRTVHQAAKPANPPVNPNPAQAATANQPPATPAPTDPAAATPVTPTVTVPPQTTDPATTGGTAAATTALGKHKHHKPVANSDSKPTEAPQTGPVTTGVEPATCDADGDGVTDPGAPASCTTGTSVDTGVVQGDVTPAPTQYSAPAPATKKHHAAPKKKRR